MRLRQVWAAAGKKPLHTREGACTGKAPSAPQGCGTLCRLSKGTSLTPNKQVWLQQWCGKHSKKLSTTRDILLSYCDQTPEPWTLGP
eukprot:175976-Chlamydomonas_euryale.AAC.1